MMSNIKKYARVTVTSNCGCKTFTRLNCGGVYHWINVLPNGKLNESSSEMTEQEGVYHWINVFPNGKLDDSSVEITEQDFVVLLEIFSKAGMRVKFSCKAEELEDEAFWLCTARAEEQKGIEMW